MCQQSFNVKETNHSHTDFIDREGLQVESLHITACEAEPKSDMHKFALSAVTGGVLFAASFISPLPCKAAQTASVSISISRHTTASKNLILYQAKNSIAAKEATVLSAKIKPKRPERAKSFDQSFDPIPVCHRKSTRFPSSGNKRYIQFQRALKVKCSKNEGHSSNESHSSSFSPSYPLEVNELLEHNLANKLKAKNYVHKFFDRIDINASGKIGIDLDKVGLGKIAAVDIVGKLESGMTNELIQAQVNNHNANIGQIACDEVRKRDNHIMATEAHNLAQDIKTRSDLREEDNHDMSMEERKAAERRAEANHDMSMEERKASLRRAEEAERRAEEAERRAEEAERRAEEAHEDARELNKLIREKVQAEIDNLKK
nr:hypothetical protein [Interfilum sp. SAG 2147]